MDSDEQRLFDGLLRLRYLLHSTQVTRLIPYPGGGKVVQLPMDTALALRERPVATGWSDHFFVEVIDDRRLLKGEKGWTHRSVTNWGQPLTLRHLLSRSEVAVMCDVSEVFDLIASRSA
jgi:hypothetical protein